MNRIEPGQTEFLVVAQVVAFSSEPGFLKLKLFTDFSEDFFQRKVLFLDFFGKMKELKIEKIKGDSKNLSLKFAGFSSREDARILLGKSLFIPLADAHKLDENQYFIHDLIGSDVYKNGVFFGSVKDVYTLPSNDVYVIIKENGEEYLLPALKKFIENFSAEEKKLILKSGEEFYDDEN